MKSIKRCASVFLAFALVIILAPLTVFVSGAYSENIGTASATISPQNHTFPSAVVGYDEQTAQTFTITNTGNVVLWHYGSTGHQAFEQSWFECGSFIAPGETLEFWMRPFNGLGVGSYEHSTSNQFIPAVSREEFDEIVSTHPELERDGYFAEFLGVEQEIIDDWSHYDNNNFWNEHGSDFWNSPASHRFQRDSQAWRDRYVIEVFAIVSFIVESGGYTLADGGGGWATLSAGSNHSMAIGINGSLWAWGRNSEGQLGVGTMTMNSHSDVPIRVGTSDDWSAVSVGDDHTIALRTDGSLWSWGANWNSQLGDGANVNRAAPARIGTDYDWIAISAGVQNSLAIRADGSLWAWGANWGGQLGDGTTMNRTIPTRVGVDNDWVAISTGGFHSLGLRTNGSLWAWGANWGGQLGNGTFTDATYPTQIGMDKDWIDISAGWTHSMALKTDGSLWTWGENHGGQLGDGTTTNRAAPARVGADNDWAAISASGTHNLALKADGSLWAWGSNWNGQLGSGTTTNRLAPTRVGADYDWVIAAASSGHSLASQADGSIWAWGWNGNFQLGDGTNTDRLSPVRIVEATQYDQIEQPHTNSFVSVIMVCLALVVIIFILLRRFRHPKIFAFNKKENVDCATTVPTNEDSSSGQTLLETHISTLRELDKAGQGKLEEPVREMLKTTEQIAAQLRKYPANADKIGLFLDYTLPTTIKTVQNYNELNDLPIKSADTMIVMGKIEEMTDTILVTFHRQLDTLFQDRVLDIEMELNDMKDKLNQAGDTTDIVSCGENKQG